MTLLLNVVIQYHHNCQLLSPNINIIVKCCQPALTLCPLWSLIIKPIVKVCHKVSTLLSNVDTQYHRCQILSLNINFMSTVVTRYPHHVKCCHLISTLCQMLSPQHVSYVKGCHQNHKKMCQKLSTKVNIINISHSQIMTSFLKKGKKEVAINNLEQWSWWLNVSAKA